MILLDRLGRDSDRRHVVTLDPALSNPDLCKVVFEDSVMYTLSTFRRRLYAADGASRDVELQAGTTGWLPAQVHAGHNVGDTDTHVIFVELKENAGAVTSDLGPSGPPVE